jgi:hypothetical protein
MRCEYGSMKVKDKIEWMKTSLFAGLECKETNPSNLATNHLAFKKQLSSMLMSALNENVQNYLVRLFLQIFNLI